MHCIRHLLLMIPQRCAKLYVDASFLNDIYKHPLEISEVCNPYTGFKPLFIVGH